MSRAEPYTSSSSSSYQHQSNVVTPPIVHQLEEDYNKSSTSATNNNRRGSNNKNGSGGGGGGGGMMMDTFLIRSDRTLRPNIGLSNSYEDALFGLALHELIDYQRIGNLLLCTLTSIILFFTTLWKRFLHPTKLILSIYLLFFVLLYAVSDIINVLLLYYPTHRFINTVHTFIINNLGIVQYPFPGRTFYLFICGTLCIAIGGSIEFLLGIGYVVSSCITIYCWYTFAEYRKPYEEMERQFFQQHYPTQQQQQDTMGGPGGTSWTSFATSTGSSILSSNQSNKSEVESLLSSAATSSSKSSSSYQNPL